jgi:hypothetical protein
MTLTQLRDFLTFRASRRHRYRQRRSKIKPEKPSSGLRCMGDPSGDETNSPVIRVYDAAGNVIETHEHAGEFNEP